MSPPTDAQLQVDPRRCFFEYLDDMNLPQEFGRRGRP